MIKLSPFKVELKANIGAMGVTEVNKSELDNALASVTNIFQLSNEDTTSFISNAKSNIVTKFNVVLYTNESKSNGFTNAINDAKSKVDNLINNYNNTGDIENTEESEGTNLGIDTEDTDKIEDTAYELLNALNGNETDNQAAKAISDSANELESISGGTGSRNGLWNDIYQVLEHSADNGEDINSENYSYGLASVIGSYFESGVSHVAIHSGGACIAAVGISTLNTSSQNIPTGKSNIQNGTKSSGNIITQCKAIMEGFSTMISQGTIKTAVVGVQVAGSSTAPLITIGNSKPTPNTYKTVEILIFVAALAAAILLNSASLASMLVGMAVTSTAVEELNKLIDNLENKLKEKANTVKSKINNYKITEYDSILNNSDVLKEKANKIIEVTENTVKPKIDKLKKVSENEIEDLSNYASKNISKLKQNSLVTRFGSGQFDKIEKIESKIKAEIPKEINDKINENLKNVDDILKLKGKELTDEEAHKVIDMASEVDNNTESIETQVEEASSKIDILSKVLKIISCFASAAIGLSASKVYKNIVGIGSKFNDANDFTAMLLAAAVKASILLTIANEQETTAGSNGTGILIPIGP